MIKNKGETSEEFIKRVEKERDQYLQDHPELQPLQDKINETLEKAGDNPVNRCAAISAMMTSTWYEIVPVWTETGYIDKKIKKDEKQKLKNSFKLLH